MNPTAAEKHAVEKEKVEKRRALGRGLESLLPGPRVVSGAEPKAIGPGVADGSGGIALSGSAGEQRAERNGASGGELPDMERTQGGAPAPRQPVTSQKKDEVLVVNLAISLIDKNPYQTRYVFDEDALIELRDSIREHGVVQPVVVRPGEEEGRYILVLGERRLRATKMAGKPTIPALIRRVSPQQAAEMTVLENIVREDLNPLEQAEAFRVLSTEFKLTQAQIADRVGVSRETVSNYMRLLRLPEKVMNYMLEDRLSFTDAREILRLEKPEHIEMVAEEVVTKRLKWDEIEQRILKLNEPFHTVPGPTLGNRRNLGARWQDPNVRAAQTEMERSLGMRVRIRDRNGKGRILIEYSTVDDYERLVGLLKGK